MDTLGCIGIHRDTLGYLGVTGIQCGNTGTNHVFIHEALPRYDDDMRHMRKKVVPRLPQIFERSVSIMVYFLCSLFGFALSVARLLDGSANFFRVDRDREN